MKLTVVFSRAWAEKEATPSLETLCTMVSVWRRPANRVKPLELPETEFIMFKDRGVTMS